MSAVGAIVRPLGVALGFLTRLPVSVPDVADRDLGRATLAFPCVGALLGAGLWALERAAFGCLSPELSALVVVAALAMVTGGLHLDGLADVFDGLGGSRGDRARFLEIMRDSRIGALGATALVLGILAKVFAVAVVSRTGAAWALVAAPAVARAGAALLIATFPYARPTGLGAGFGRGMRRRYACGALALAAALVLALGAGLRGAVATVAAWSAALALARVIARRLGGLTGDVYGAAIEISEIVFLTVASARLG